MTTQGLIVKKIKNDVYYDIFIQFSNLIITNYYSFMKNY